MPEVLRDLVVTLSLQSDNFSRNINSINRQIREAESAFRLAGAGVDHFDRTAAGMSSRLSMLQTNLGRQRDAVQQYERVLAAANARLQESHARYQDYSSRLDEARQKHQSLGKAIEDQALLVNTLRDAGMENTMYYEDEAAELERLRQEYAASGEEVKQLSGQCEALQKNMQRSADAVSTAQTNLNNAKAAVRETEAEIEKLNAQLRISQSAWTTAGTALTAFSTKLASIGKAATQLGRSMMLGITTPIAALGKNVIQSTIDFESSFASVRKTVEATEEEFSQLAAASKEMSTKVAASTSQINEVMATGGQLGIANEHLKDFTKVMIDLGNSCEDLDAGNAATQLARFANIMGTDQSQFDHIGSTIVDLGNNFATTEAPIAEMAMRLAGAGRQIGLTEAQVLGLAASLSSVGIQAQMGGSAMSKALIKMEVAAQTGGDALSDFARVSGMTEREFVEAWGNDPVAVFQRFITGVAELNDEGISAVKTLDDMGIKEIRLRDTLLRATNANQLFARAQQRATRAWQENTALQTEANKRYATLESRLKNLKNQAVLFAQTLGDDMRPAIERVMQGVAGFIGRLQDMDASQRQALLRFAGIAAAAGPAIFLFGKLSTGVSKITGLLGTFCTAVGQAGGGFSGFLAVLSRSPAVWLAVGSAVAYGLAKLVDWVSGARAAREAQEQLNETVRIWGENVTTAYEKSEGLRLFGLTEDDFSVDAASTGDWLRQTLQTWSDGKAETDAIVAETVRGFVEGTTSIREALQTLRDSASGGTIGDLDRDLETLDAIDREVEAILRKRRNGLLTDDDTARLQALMDQREAIRIKYQLVSDTEGAFGSIVQGVEAALSRGADGAVTYANAFAAATQGMGAFTDSLNQEYDARYRIISAMEEGAEKEAALAELRSWYNEQALFGQQQYYNALVRTAEETGIFAEGGEFAETADQLRTINALMEAAAGKDGMSAEMNALRDALSGLDETGIVEMEAAITAMEAAAAAAGESVPEEVLAAKEALEQVKAAATDTSNVFSDDVAASLEEMFSGLGGEVHEVYASLNCDNLTTAYDAWAAGEHAPIIPDIDTQTLTEIELTGTITSVLQREGVVFSVDTRGNLTGLEWPEGTTFTTDIKGNITSAETPEGTVYTIDARGNIVSVGKPDGVTYTVDATGSITGVVTPEGLSFTVDGQGNITSVVSAGGNGEEGFAIDCTGRVSELSFPEGSVFETDVDGNLTSVKTPDGITYAIDASGNITSVTTEDGVSYTLSGDGVITAVAMDPDVVLPTVELQATATVQSVNFDEGVYTDSRRPDLEFDAGQNRETRNVLGLTDFSAPQAYESLHNLAAAVREYNSAVESGDVNAAQNWSASISYLGSTLGSDLGFKGGQGFEAMAQYIVNGMQLLSDGALDPEAAEQYRQTVSDLITVLDSDTASAAAAATNFGTTFQEGLSDSLNSQGWETTGDDVLSRIEAGFSSASDRAAQIGDDVGAGIGEGEAAHDFSADAEAAIANDETALRSAAQSNSPAARFMPLGEDIAAGVGQGMAQHDFSAESSAAIGQLMGSLSSAMAAQANAARAGARAVGSAVSSGIASGISAGTSAVIAAAIRVAQAAVAAAKLTLGIRSPSSVFREEVGLMAMKGLGEGFLRGEKEQAAIIRNAARYLTGEARGSVIVGSTDRRRTYNHNSTVNLNVDSLQVRDAQDIRSLAEEIASLTRQQQRGAGLRMA